MSTLTSASQAVLDATYNAYDPKDPIVLRRCAAAALRAAAKAVEPENHVEDIHYVPEAYLDGFKDAIAELLAIADELERQ